MAERAELLAEAYRRGLLPPEQKAAYEEAQRRGLVPAVSGGSSTPQARAQRDAQRRSANTPGALRAFNNGFAFGGMNSIDAAGAALETGVHNALAHATGQPDSGYGMREAYDAVRRSEAEAGGRFGREHPVQNIAAGITGAVVNPVNRLAGGYVGRGATLAAKAGRGAVSGGAVGALYGAAGAEPGETTLQGAARGGTIGAVVGGAAPVVERAAGAAVNAVRRAPKASAVRMTEELRTAKQAAYKAVDDMGVAYTPQAASSLADGIEQELTAGGISDARHTKAFSLMVDLGKRLRNGQPVTLGELDNLRQVVRRDVGGPRADDAERFFGDKIINNIDEFVDAAGPEQLAGGVDAQKAAAAIAKARDLNTRFRKVQSVEDARESAQLRAGSTGSGGNVNNATRQNLRKFVDPTSGQRIRNASEAEKQALRDVVVGTGPQNALRLVGKLSPEGNGLMLAGHAIAAIPSHGLSGVLALVGMGAKHIADRQTGQAVDDLIMLMARGAPAERVTAEQQLSQLAARNPQIAAVYREVRAAIPAVATNQLAPN